MEASRDVNASDRQKLDLVLLQLTWIRKRVWVLERRGYSRREAIRQAVDEQMTRESILDDV